MLGKTTRPEVCIVVLESFDESKPSLTSCRWQKSHGRSRVEKNLQNGNMIDAYFKTTSGRLFLVA